MSVNRQLYTRSSFLARETSKRIEEYMRNNEQLENEDILNILNIHLAKFLETSESFYYNLLQYPTRKKQIPLFLEMM
jgi:hypothetical protein